MLKYCKLADTSDSKLEFESFINGTKISSKNSKPFWIFVAGRATEKHPPSKDEGLWDILHSMNMVLDIRKSNFGNQKWLQSHIWFFMTLYYNVQQILLQNPTVFLLQNATKVYHKIRQLFYFNLWQFYRKMGQLLENATMLLQNTTFVPRYDVYYKICRYIEL